jgi:mRNA interferase MazF
MCKKGDVYWAEIPIIEDSRIQSGYRPVVITSNKFATKHSEVIQYMPLTSEIKRTDMPVHVIVNPPFLPVKSMVLAEQEGIIDKHRLRTKIGSLSNDDMIRIDVAKLIQGEIDINKVITFVRHKNSQKNENKKCCNATT